MNQGRTLQSLATEVERRHKTKVDYLVPSRSLRMTKTMEMDVPGHGQYLPNDIAHGQIGDRLGIPRAYYDKMRQEHPSLLAENVNTWLNTDDVRMVRTLDGKMRAMASDRYNPLENYDLMAAALPVFHDVGLEVRSSEVTDSRLYIKGVIPGLQAEIKKGDIVAWGAGISNSEVAMGALAIYGFSERLICTNGMTHQAQFRRSHVGRKNIIDGEVEQFYSDETKRADDRALWLKFRDTLRGVLGRDHFEKTIEKMQGSTKREINDPLKTIAVVVKRFGMADEDRKPLFHFLNESKDFTQYGLAQAVTRYAEDQKSYDRSSDLESYGGKIIDMTDSEWQQVENEKVKMERQLALA